MAYRGRMSNPSVPHSSLVSRRRVLSGLAMLGLTAADLSLMSGTGQAATGASTQAPPADDLAWPPAMKPGSFAPSFPSHDPWLAKEVVGQSHSSLERVRELVSAQPELAKASWDWGFGDWETALGAASHTGQRAIAEYLLENGAPPTLYSATMLGQLEVVKSMIAAQPGVQSLPGPHGIPLINHARAGGETSAPVLAYLESVGGADRTVPTEPITAEQKAGLLGRYSFGPGPRDVFEVVDVRDQLGILRVGAVRRALLHRGNMAFSPGGAEHVRIRFANGALTVASPDVILTARKVG